MGRVMSSLVQVRSVYWVKILGPCLTHHTIGSGQFYRGQAAHDQAYVEVTDANVMK
jgi:hypothetical protein